MKFTPIVDTDDNFAELLFVRNHFINPVCLQQTPGFLSLQPVRSMEFKLTDTDNITVSVLSNNVKFAECKGTIYCSKKDIKNLL